MYIYIVIHNQIPKSEECVIQKKPKTRSHPKIDCLTTKYIKLHCDAHALTLFFMANSWEGSIRTMDYVKTEDKAIQNKGVVEDFLHFDVQGDVKDGWMILRHIWMMRTITAKKRLTMKNTNTKVIKIKYSAAAPAQRGQPMEWSICLFASSYNISHITLR